MLNAQHIALAGLVLLGCEEQKAGRFDEVRLFYFEGLDTHPQETIDDAEEILGLDLIVVGDALRSVVVFYIEGELPPEGSEYTGEGVQTDPCGRVVWSENDPRNFAHELGHALSIGHVDDPDNLMFPGGSGTDLNEEQVDTMRWAAWWLETQCAQQ